MELRPHEIEAIRLAQEYDKIDKMDEDKKRIYDRQGFRLIPSLVPSPPNENAMGNGCYHKKNHLHS